MPNMGLEFGLEKGKFCKRKHHWLMKIDGVSAPILPPLKSQRPTLAFKESEIHFEAQSLWSSNDVNPDFYDTGFEVTSLSTEERKIMRKLVEQIGFNN